MLKIFFYQLLALRYRERRDYLDMGFGITARHKRCAHFWRHHIENCLSFQRAELSDISAGERIYVLGAGRCLDLDLKYFAEKGVKLHLIDADPGCQYAWRRIKQTYRNKCEVSSQIADLSGTITVWTRELKSFLNKNKAVSIASLCKHIDSFKVSNVTIAKPVDYIISLNLLSQIPIYWRDRFYNILETYLNITCDEKGKLPEPLEKALTKLMARLQEQHLNMLSGSRAKKIILITDQYFNYFRADNYRWQQEAALYLDSELNLKGYLKASEKSWYWDIAPQGIESEDYGAVHQVRAISYQLSV